VFVLGIDPGLTRCGYGAVRGPRKPVAVAIGVITTSADDPIQLRLAGLQADVSDLLDELKPDAVAVERILFQVNTRTAIPVAQALGVVLAEAGRRAIPVHEYSPNEIKSAVAGHGSAAKPEIQRMVKARLQLDVIPKPADAADGAAVALCHLAHAPGLLRMEAAQRRQAERRARVNPAQVNRAQVKPAQVNPTQVNPTQVNPTQANGAQANRAQAKRGPGQPSSGQPSPGQRGPKMTSPSARMTAHGQRGQRGQRADGMVR